MRELATQTANHDAEFARALKRPVTSPAPADGLHVIRQLQQTMGNRALQRFLLANLRGANRVQTKLTVSSPEDVHEQEAERVAKDVMNMQDPAASVSAPPLSLPAQSVQRVLSEPTGSHENSSSGSEGTAHLESEIASFSSGTKLSDSERAFFEPRFGRDFSGVHIHSNSDAARLAGSVNAQAFTFGNRIFFNAGQYSPHSDTGKHLLAHELTHVVQQGYAPTTSQSHDHQPGPVPQATSPHGSIGNDRLTGTLTGAAVGGAIGAGIGAFVGGPVGALIGGGVGAAIGGGIGFLVSGPPRPIAVRNGPSHAPIDTPDTAGMEIAITLTSSTGVDADMASIEDSEQVALSANHTGSFAGMAAIPSNQSGFMPGHPIPNDRHTTPKDLVLDRADNHGGDGSIDKDQLDVFRAPGTTAAAVIPSSGYRIKRIIKTGPGSKVVLRTEKSPQACTVNGFTTTAGPSPMQADEVVVRP